MNRIPDTIKHLIIINIIMFVATQMMPEQFYNLFAMHFPLNPHFRIWQIVTHMFMHGGFAHIAFNMYALWAFGAPLEYMWGKKKFLIFYFVSGLGAILLYTGVAYFDFNNYMNELIQAGMSKEVILQSLIENKVTGAYQEFLPVLQKMAAIFNGILVGASGAIYGVLVAFAFYFPNAELMLIFIPYPIKAKYFVPLLVLADFMFGITNVFHTPIAHMAHVGGAITGFILMKMWGKHKIERWY